MMIRWRELGGKGSNVGTFLTAIMGVALGATLTRHTLEAGPQLLELLLTGLTVHATVDVGHALAVHLHV